MVLIIKAVYKEGEIIFTYSVRGLERSCIRDVKLQFSFFHNVFDTGLGRGVSDAQCAKACALVCAAAVRFSA